MYFTGECIQCIAHMRRTKSTLDYWILAHMLNCSETIGVDEYILLVPENVVYGNLVKLRFVLGTFELRKFCLLHIWSKGHLA